MRKINKDILFLSGVILLCFGFLLFHINPYSFVEGETLSGKLSLLFGHLPEAFLSIFSGCVMMIKGLRKE